MRKMWPYPDDGVRLHEALTAWDDERLESRRQPNYS